MAFSKVVFLVIVFLCSPISASFIRKFLTECFGKKDCTVEIPTTERRDTRVDGGAGRGGGGTRHAGHAARLRRVVHGSELIEPEKCFDQLLSTFGPDDCLAPSHVVLYLTTLFNNRDVNAFVNSFAKGVTATASRDPLVRHSQLEYGTSIVTQGFIVMKADLKTTVCQLINDVEMVKVYLEDNPSRSSVYMVRDLDEVLGVMMSLVAASVDKDVTLVHHDRSGLTVKQSGVAICGRKNHRYAENYKKARARQAEYFRERIVCPTGTRMSVWCDSMYKYFPCLADERVRISDILDPFRCHAPTNGREDYALSPPTPIQCKFGGQARSDVCPDFPLMCAMTVSCHVDEERDDGVVCHVPTGRWTMGPKGKRVVMRTEADTEMWVPGGAPGKMWICQTPTALRQRDLARIEPSELGRLFGDLSASPEVVEAKVTSMVTAQAPCEVTHDCPAYGMAWLEKAPKSDEDDDVIDVSWLFEPKKRLRFADAV